MILISRPLRPPRSNDHGQAEVVLEVSGEILLHAVVTRERGCAVGLLPDREAVGAGDTLRISGRDQMAGAMVARDPEVATARVPRSMRPPILDLNG